MDPTHRPELWNRIVHPTRSPYRSPDSARNSFPDLSTKLFTRLGYRIVQPTHSPNRSPDLVTKSFTRLGHRIVHPTRSPNCSPNSVTELFNQFGHRIVHMTRSPNLWSLKNKELFRIGPANRPCMGGVHPTRSPCMGGVQLVYCPRIEPLKRGGVPNWTKIFSLVFDTMLLSAYFKT